MENVFTKNVKIFLVENPFPNTVTSQILTLVRTMKKARMIYLDKRVAYGINNKSFFSDFALFCWTCQSINLLVFSFLTGKMLLCGKKGRSMIARSRCLGNMLDCFRDDCITSYLEIKWFKKCMYSSFVSSHIHTFIYTGVINAVFTAMSTYTKSNLSYSNFFF